MQKGKCKSQRSTDDDKETLAIECPFRTDAEIGKELFEVRKKF